MQKEYGKLTTNQFRNFIGQLPEFRKRQTDLKEYISGVSEERLKEVFISGYSWSWVYELSFHEHLALVLFAFNKSTGQENWLHHLTPSSCCWKLLIATTLMTTMKYGKITTLCMRCKT